MANTYTLIASTTVGSGGTSSIDFNTISSSYTDLVLNVSVRTNNAFNQDWLLLKFNNTNSSLAAVRISGTGSGVQGGYNDPTQIWGATGVGATATANTFSNAQIYIQNYTSPTLNKTWISESVNEINATGTEVITNLFTGTWSNTAAITRVTLTPYSAGTIQQYSTAYLYGIKNS